MAYIIICQWDNQYGDYVDCLTDFEVFEYLWFFFFLFLKYRILDSSSMSISRKYALAIQNILQGNMEKSDKYMVVCPCIYPSFSVNISEICSQVGSVKLALCGVLVPVRFFSPRLNSLWVRQEQQREGSAVALLTAVGLQWEELTWC